MQWKYVWVFCQALIFWQNQKCFHQCTCGKLTLFWWKLKYFLFPQVNMFAYYPKIWPVESNKYFGKWEQKKIFPPVLHQCMTSCQLKWRIQGHFEQFSKCYFFTSKHFISIQTIRKFLDLKTCISKKSLLPKLNKFKKHKIMQHQISPIFVVLEKFESQKGFEIYFLQTFVYFHVPLSYSYLEKTFFDF